MKEKQWLAIGFVIGVLVAWAFLPKYEVVEVDGRAYKVNKLTGATWQELSGRWSIMR